ncbi:MAG: hypothetical protein LBU47_00425 [Christensenellaceae bacterium]|jgi:hypothetical protein|nr:hypothetical protein [Christensenellaceae bacterium]
MSFYSYKNTGAVSCPGVLSAGDCTKGLSEKVCVQVKKVYDSCLYQAQQTKIKVKVTDMLPVYDCDCPQPAFTAPIIFESCRSSTINGTLRGLTIDRLCDRPNFARVRAAVDIPIEILFTDCNCREGIGKGVVTVNRDVLLCIPDESIVPFTIETLVSAICVSGNYIGDDTFEITVCVTIIMKVLAEVEMLIPSYGLCSVPPCEEFAESICDEFFSLPIFPQNPCGTIAC